MTSFVEKNGFFKYLSYDKEPRWFNIFVHTGFGTALLVALAALFLTYVVY